MVLSKFDSLSLRPPTPPKDIEDARRDADETLQFLEDPFGEKPLPPKLIATKSLLNTPEQSPSSEISIPSSAASTRKRVNFELQTCAIPTNKAITQSWTPTRSSPLRPLPQTRVSKPLKSILKPCDETATPPPAEDGTAAHKFKTFAEMLDSIVKLLASAERSSKMDAYHSLQRTMQAYDKIPDDQALRQKMSLLTQFMRRDVQAPSPTGTGLDSQLISQALKLLMALFRITHLTSVMDDDFCAFIIDRSIQAASDSSMPKTIVNTHLAVLMQQSFRPRTMTTARVEKILDVLDTIHERVSGYSVQAYRIRIYRKLIQQRPDVMIKQTERWFKHTVKALISGQKDIYQSALDTALSAAKTISHDRHVAKSVLAVLNRVRGDGEAVGRVMSQEMERMLSGDNAVMVPQIWSAITALLRDSLHGQMFSALKEWLGVLEKCLRSDKDQVKLHANVAFCFLLYSVNLAPNTSEGWTKMFLNIPLHQLQRCIPSKKAERDAITSGYVTLLYYAFRPAASFEQLDRYWTEFVASFWNPLIHLSSTQQAVAACRVVSALLAGSRKPWNEQRALDLRPQYMVQRSELPLLEPKWVRRSLPLVLQFVETLLDATPWSENEQQEDEPIKVMWLAVIDSLVEASSKEVMASSETRDAMAHIVNLLRRLWDRHTAKLALPQQKEDLWADKFCFLIETVVQRLGTSQFAEKCLMRNSDNEFQVASTPSHRSRQHGVRISPLLYLIDLLGNQSEGRLGDSVRLRAMKLAIDPCLHIQKTRHGRLDLLRDCAIAVDSSSSTPVALKLWAQIAALLRFAIQEQTPSSNEQVSRPLGKEYEVIVELLRLGSRYMLNMAQGHEVLASFIDIVRREAGEGAVIIAVVEQVSEHVLKHVPDKEKVTCLSFASILLRNLPQQTSRRVLDQARQNLGPTSLAAGRNADFDPYNHFYDAIVSIGSAAYVDLDHKDIEETANFLAAFRLSVQHCQTSHLAVYLRKTQEMIRAWIQDPERKMQSKEQPLKRLHGEVVNLWREINKAIERLPRKDSQILLHMEPLISAGFLSTRLSIVNVSILTWNETFGKQSSLQYPAHLEQALQRLRNTVDISLPSLEARVEVNEPPSFYDSDTVTEKTARAFKSPRVKESPFKVSRATRKSTSRSPATSSRPTRRVPTRQTPKVRLRHDNSQIQFEPIVSSPSNPFNQESQVLTERQKEMIERQRLTTGLFANMSATASQPEALSSPVEMHSDMLSTDELPDHVSRSTPMKALAALDPMDVFLGSSPTPHARKSTQHIVSDDTSIATPTAIRTIQLANIEDLGSSPPRFEKTTSSSAGPKELDVSVKHDVEPRQPENLLSTSFDDGTTIDEEDLLAAMAAEHEDNDPPTDTAMFDLPSSTIDLQLHAQIDADMHIHGATSSQPTNEDVPESNNIFVDATSHQVPTSQTEVEDSQLQIPENTDNSDNEPDEDASSTSRIGDSFLESRLETGTPHSRDLRRSSRNSLVSSPAVASSAKKRKSTSAKQENKAPGSKKVETHVPPAELEEDDMLDNIIVQAPKRRRGRPSLKRKSMDDSPVPSQEQVSIPETIRKRGGRRSQSLLYQVENSQDILVEDTPANKRAKQRTKQDVSEAKPTPSSETKRMSHVQIIAKQSPRAKSVRESSIVIENEVVPSTTFQSTSHESGSATTGRSSEHTPQPAVEAGTPSRSFTERVILTPRSIINQLKKVKDYFFSTPQMVLDRDEFKELDDVLFDIRRRVFAAGERGVEQGQGS